MKKFLDGDILFPRTAMPEIRRRELIKYEQFIGQVQNRARLGTTGGAVAATRSALQTLGQRLHGNEVPNLAEQLPKEIGLYLTMSDRKDSFGVDDFCGALPNTNRAIYRNRPITHASYSPYLKEATTKGAIDHVLAQLPDEYRPLILEGHEGALK